MVWDGNLFGYYTPPAPAGGPVMPSPTPQPTPSPSPQPGQGSQQNPQQLAQMIQQLLGGNAGGAQQADRGGFGNGGAFGGAAGAAGGSNGNGYIDLGPWGAGALGTAAAVAPGWAGAGLGALQAAMRGYNLTNTNRIRGTQGIPDTDFWQAIGAITGGNNYGGLGGNATVANPQQLGQRLGQVPAYNLANSFFGGFGAPAETAAGGTYQPGPGGILGFLARTFGLTDAEARSLSPDEVNHLVNKTVDPDIAALWGGGGGNNGYGNNQTQAQSNAQKNRYGGVTGYGGNAGGAMGNGAAGGGFSGGGSAPGPSTGYGGI